MITRPLLAAPIQVEGLKSLNYPVIVSPKVDGIRCLQHPELGAVTRSFKPIPNEYIRGWLAAQKQLLNWLDGELTVGAPHASDVFNKTTSAVMSHDGAPEFTYWVFDQFHTPNLGYDMRLLTVEDQVRRYVASLPLGDRNNIKVRVLPFHWVMTIEDLLHHEELFVERGFEGLMIRNSHGAYKSGRSTQREQILLKLKRVEDAEATIVGFEALKRNQNEKLPDAFGLSKRSSHQANKVADELLGNLLVEHATFGQFAVGSGFDVGQREEIWQNQAKYLGKHITFKYQAVGVVDKPRFPIFKGFRAEE